jgi:hypothetical protein
LRALERICNDLEVRNIRVAGCDLEVRNIRVAARMLRTSRCDLEVRNIRVAGKTDLLIDVTLRHPFIGAGRSGHTQGQLRHPDNPDQ